MTGKWRAVVRMRLRSWYNEHASIPDPSMDGVADTLLESLVAEVEAETAADLREELRRTQRAVENLREQHRIRTWGNRDQAGRDRTWRSRYEAARAREAVSLDRAQRAEANANRWFLQAAAADLKLSQQGDTQ